MKMTLAKGTSLEDPSGLFNASLEGKVRGAIDFYAGDKIDETALQALIRATVALNVRRELPLDPSALRSGQRALEERRLWRSFVLRLQCVTKRLILRTSRE